MVGPTLPTGVQGSFPVPVLGMTHFPLEEAHGFETLLNTALQAAFPRHTRH